MYWCGCSLELSILIKWVYNGFWLKHKLFQVCVAQTFVYKYWKPCKSSKSKIFHEVCMYINIYILLYIYYYYIYCYCYSNSVKIYLVAKLMKSLCSFFILLSANQNFWTCWERTLIFRNLNRYFDLSEQLMRTHFKILGSISSLSSNGNWLHGILTSLY